MQTAKKIVGVVVFELAITMALVIGIVRFPYETNLVLRTLGALLLGMAMYKIAHWVLESRGEGSTTG